MAVVSPHRQLTVGTSKMVIALIPFSLNLGTWLALPKPSLWVIKTIRVGYAVQFTRCPPRFIAILFNVVAGKDAPVRRAEIAVLLAKDRIEPEL